MSLDFTKFLICLDSEFAKTPHGDIECSVVGLYFVLLISSIIEHVVILAQVKIHELCSVD